MVSNLKIFLVSIGMGSAIILHVFDFFTHGCLRQKNAWKVVIFVFIFLSSFLFLFVLGRTDLLIFDNFTKKTKKNRPQTNKITRQNEVFTKISSKICFSVKKIIFVYTIPSFVSKSIVEFDSDLK